MNVRKTLRLLTSILFSIILLCGANLSALAGVIEDTHLDLLYEVSSEQYRCVYYVDPSSSAQLTDVTKDSMDQAVAYSNILRIVATDTDYKTLSDKEQKERIQQYISEAGFSKSDILIYFYHDSNNLTIGTTDAFDAYYGDSALSDLETMALESEDSENTSLDTRMLYALCDYANGERPEVSSSGSSDSDSQGYILPLPGSSGESSQLGQSCDYMNSSTGYEAYIEDNAGLLDETGVQQVLESMKPLTEYENVIFATTVYNPGTQKEYSRNLGDKRYSSTSNYSVFLIDMANRQIYIYSSESIYHTITTGKANMITDNVYRYATNGDYAGCASKAYEQMLMVFEGQHLFSTMRLICCILLSLIMGLTICWTIMVIYMPTKRASVNEIASGMGTKKLSTRNVRRRHLRSRFVKSSSGSGSHGGGGGGGHGGGGGGHGF